MLRIDIWSDIACPWCWVGKRHLERALHERDEQAEIHWHAFELDPAAPRQTPEPYDYVQRLATKYGTTPPQAQAMIDRMVKAGADAGVEFRFDRIRPGNSFDAHRVMALARRRGLQTPLCERLFQAYFSEGRSVGSGATLVALGEDVGLDADEVQGVVSGDLYADEVREDERKAAGLGVTGVPFFLVAERYAVAGAQPVDVLREVLARVARQVQTELEAGGEQCGPDGCAVPEAEVPSGPPTGG